MDIDFFLKKFLKVNKEINVYDGLTLVWNGEVKDAPFRALKYIDKIPIFQVHNPNDSPYTSQALTWFLDETLESFSRLVPFKENIAMYWLYEIDCDSLYLPFKKLNEIQSCLQGRELDFSDNEFDNIDKVSGHFNGEFYIETGDEAIICNYEFIVDSIEGNGDTDELIEYLRDYSYDMGSEWHEPEIWSCFSSLYYNKNFRSEDMGWNSDISIF